MANISSQFTQLATMVSALPATGTARQQNQAIQKLARELTESIQALANGVLLGELDISQVNLEEITVLKDRVSTNFEQKNSGGVFKWRWGFFSRIFRRSQTEVSIQGVIAEASAFLSNDVIKTLDKSRKAYEQVQQHCAHGRAYVETGNLAAARECLAQLEKQAAEVTACFFKIRDKYYAAVEKNRVQSRQKTGALQRGSGMSGAHESAKIYKSECDRLLKDLTDRITPPRPEALVSPRARGVLPRARPLPNVVHTTIPEGKEDSDSEEGIIRERPGVRNVEGSRFIRGFGRKIGLGSKMTPGLDGFIKLEGKGRR